MTESVSTNPYSSPVVPENPRAIQRARVATRVRIPAACLLVAATLHIVLMGALATVAIGTAPSWSALFAKVGIFNAIAFVVYLAEQSFLIYAAIRMWRMQSLGLCRIAAIFASLPVLAPGAWPGIPLGIWAAIVLFMPSTAQEFDRPVAKDSLDE
ncbi:hypothetical protein NA78x_005377 [Anatilimnocola sp. NA78]|uniref:hypothetical protein n=1 Tax=Anatilimnocola sp. NA78 TaxID=3415683 RepID=UPI003CE474D5